MRLEQRLASLSRVIIPYSFKKSLAKSLILDILSIKWEYPN